MTPRIWAVALFCSLAANVFLAGVIATIYLARDQARIARMSVYTVPWAYRVVGDEVGSQARRIYRKYRPAMAEERRGLMQDYKAINAVLAAPQFDDVSFKESLRRLRDSTTTAQATMHDAMAEFAGELTSEQRRALAETVTEWAERREERALRREERIERREREESSD